MVNRVYVLEARAILQKAITSKDVSAEVKQAARQILRSRRLFEKYAVARAVKKLYADKKQVVIA